MQPSAVEQVLQRLKNVKSVGKGWSAPCPSHDDKHNSLSIHEGPDGRALLHCFAGCEVDEIVKAIDLELRDLFPEGAGHFSERGARSVTRQGLSVEELARDKG